MAYILAKGYVVLRFLADNAVVVFHCHILWRHATGMRIAFQVLGSESGVFERTRLLDSAE